MRYITEPSVYLVGRQEVAQEGVDAFLADHGVTWETDTEVGAEALCETAGRVCYMSFAKPRPGGNAAYLDHIKQVGHGSVTEHAVWNLLLTGISRTCSHELVRHRTGVAYSQLSQRYVDESVGEYVVPRDLQTAVNSALYMKAVSTSTDPATDLLVRPAMTDAEANAKWPDVAVLAERDIQAYYDASDAGEVWLDSVGESHAAYIELVNYLAAKAQAERPDLTKTEARKYARQAARSVLPNATETKIFFTANARALRHILELRVNRHAEPEIRVLFHKVWKLLAAEAPALFDDYAEAALPDGTFELVTKYRKI